MIQMQDELRYATTVAAAMDAIVVVNEHQKIILFNNVAERLFGYRQDDVIGQPLEILLPQDAKNRHSDHVHNFIASGEKGRAMAKRQIVHGRHAKGHYVVVEASISQTTVRGKNYCTAVLRDTTPLRKTETLLRKKSSELEQYLKQYKIELTATRSRLSDVQRLSQTGIWELDLKENILYWSDEVYEIFEIDKTRFGASYDAFLDAIHPADRVTVDNVYRESLISKTPYQLQHRLLTKDGRVKHVEERCETFYNDNGEPQRSVGTIQDISSQVIADQQRRHLQNLLLRAETLAEIGSWEWNIATDKVYWSPELYRQYGIDQSLVPEPDFALAMSAIHPDDREIVNRTIQDTLSNRTNDTHQLEYRIRRPDGEVRYVRSHGEVVRNEDGTAEFLYAIVKDITDYVRAESQIRKSNQLLEAVFDTVHVCIAYLDRDMNFIHVNRPYAEVDNKDPGFFIGKNHFHLYPNKENEVIFRNAVNTGERVVFNAKPFEYANNPERGMSHWDWTLTPVKDETGYVTGLVLSLLEVSERINAIEALQNNEEQLKTLNENLEQIVAQRTLELEEERNFIDTVLQTQGALVIVLDRNGCIVRFNRACEDTSGYSFSEVRGKPVWHYVIPENERNAVEAVFKGLTENTLPSRFENHWINRSGGRRLIEWSNSTICDNDGIVRYIIATGIDVTERRQAEQQLRKSESSLQQAQRIAKLGSWEWHIPTGKLWWSNEVYRIFKREPGDYLPVYESFLRMVHPEDVQLVKNSEQQALISGHLDIIHRIVLPDREIRIVHELGEVEYDNAGGPLMMRGTVHDITEMKHAEEERNQLHRQLQQAQKMESIGHLTGGLAHDFNNILSAILGFTHLAISRFAPDRKGTLGGYLSEIETAGKRAGDLVRQMLAFSRGDNQKQILLNPKFIIGESVQMLRPTIPAYINVIHRILDEDIQIHTDALQLQQAIINLVINARDALQGKGDIEVKLSAQSIHRMECTSCHKMFGGQFVTISVNDNGQGIANEFLPRMFEPFFTTKEVGQGSGMGLAMVHGFVHASNGHILVDSKLQQGTSIQMFFPLIKPDEISQDHATIVDFEEKQTNTGEHKILVVDDEPTVVNLLSEILGLYHYRVYATTSSQQALTWIQQAPQSYDLLITDQSMPELTGTELAQNVRKVSAELPIILCSGYSDQVNDSNFHEFSVSRYLNKPVDQEQLVQTIKELLDPERAPQRNHS